MCCKQNEYPHNLSYDFSIDDKKLCYWNARNILSYMTTTTLTHDPTTLLLVCPTALAEILLACRTSTLMSQRIFNMEGIVQKGISIESILHLAIENNLFQVIPSIQSGLFHLGLALRW